MAQLAGIPPRVRLCPHQPRPEDQMKSPAGRGVPARASRNTGLCMNHGANWRVVALRMSVPGQHRQMPNKAKITQWRPMPIPNGPFCQILAKPWRVVRGRPVFGQAGKRSRIRVRARSRNQITTVKSPRKAPSPAFWPVPAGNAGTGPRRTRSACTHQADAKYSRQAQAPARLKAFTILRFLVIKPRSVSTGS